MPRDRDRRARVGVVAHAVHDGGGQERAIAELIRRIHRDYDVVVYSSELARDLRPAVTWKRVPAPRKPAPIRFLLFYLLGGVRLARAQLDVVHAVGAIVPQRLDVVTVQCCHTAFWRATRGTIDGTPRLRRVNTALARLLLVLAERWSFRAGRTKMLAAVSSGAAHDLATSFPNVPTRVIHNGVDTSRFRPDASVRHEVRSRLGVAQDRFVVLFVGGDWFRKGLPVAVEALGRLDRQDAELWVVGSGDEGRLAELARDRGVERHIRFLGFRSDAERYYQAADAFLLPTTYESFSLATLEAAASGLPLVVTPVNGVDELVGADGGLVVDAEPGAIAGALARLAAVPALRAELGAVARARAQVFSWDRAALLVRQAYDESRAAEARGSQELGEVR